MPWDFSREVDELRARSADLESFVLALIPKLVERDRLQTEEIRALRSALRSVESRLGAQGPEPATFAPAARVEVALDGVVVECQSCGARFAESAMRITDDGLLCEACFSIRA